MILTYYELIIFWSLVRVPPYPPLFIDILSIFANYWSDPQMVSLTERGYGDNPITSMKRIRYTTEQIIAKLRQADTGKTVEEICRGNNVSEQTFHRWGKKYGNWWLDPAF